jgi:hypothetical protein
VVIAVAARNYQRFRVLITATGIWIKVGAPVRGPLSSIPVIVTITMLVRNNAVVPMVIDVDVIEANVIVMVMVVPMAVVVIVIVAPSPSVWPPPGLSPASKP